MADLQDMREKNFRLTLDSMRSLDVGDQMVVQAVAMIDELTKVINRLSMRLREWTSWGVPECKRELQDIRKLAELVSSLDQKSLSEDIRNRASKLSRDLPEDFGVKIAKEDWKAIQSSAMAINALFTEKDNLDLYLESIMKRVAPNIKAVCGASIGAKLIAIAGSLKRLSEMPASTVQMLGAEKALFRHLRTGAKCPKHGVIIQHPLLANASKKDKGRVARGIADKTSIASKVDYFKGEFVGDDLRRKLEVKFA